MRKAFTIIILALLVLSVFVSCDDDSIIDDAFGNMVTLTYNGNGSTSGKMAPERIVKEAPLTIKDNGFKRTDYHFLGWNTAADGTGKVYEIGATVNLTENVTLYAQWAHDEATVKYLANGGTAGTMADQVVYTNTDFALKPNEFTKTDYSFIGWNTSADGSGDGFLDGAITSIAGDMTLYAQWVEGVLITSETTAMTTGKYNLISNVTIASRVTVTGSATINLLAGNKLTLDKGINVGEGNTVTFTGSGDLKVEAPDTHCAGIGGNENENAGTIIINGGNLVVNGSTNAAAIGGGQNGNGGHITITGGTVKASGGSDGAGIGSGYNEFNNPDVNGGIIEISGGTVTASGMGNSAGIGGGYRADSGLITISGTADVSAYGGYEGPGIGCGGKYYEFTIATDTGTIEIKGGKVYAEGRSNSAGIGGGSNANAGTITISGGEITAEGGENGAGIGGGSEGNGGTINISGGKVTVEGGEHGAGIGGGSNGNGGTIKISGGVLDVSAGADGAGIGGGYKGEGGSITISGGTLDVYSNKDGAGIGSGYNESGNSSFTGGTINISDGTINVNKTQKFNVLGGAGIGGGKESSGGTITISGGTLIVRSWGNGAGIGGGDNTTSTPDKINGGTIEISGGTVSAYGGYGAAGIGGGENGDGGSISIGSDAVIVIAEGGDGAAGIGHGFQGDDGSLSLDLGADLLVSDNGTDWDDFDGSTRKKYMKSK